MLRWSEAVNASVEDMVVGVPPFPGVRESLERLAESADIMVVSATPGEALEREWNAQCNATADKIQEIIRKGRQNAQAEPRQD